MEQFSVFRGMKEYQISRDDFYKLFSFVEKRLFDQGYYDVTTSSFKYWYDEESIYICHMISGTIVSWYKHCGRCNAANKDLTYDEFEVFANEFKEELYSEVFNRRIDT
mgnify:CR=1 FL=1